MSETGNTVVEWDGTFRECQTRTGQCRYACCKFGALGNWIFALPGEVETADEQGLSKDHLQIEDYGEGSKIVCQRPCVSGEYKPIDCAIYPLSPANEAVTEFIVASNQKCPIPYEELLEHASKVRDVLLKWETEHPGSIASLVKAGKSYKGYQALPYRLDVYFTTIGVVQTLGYQFLPLSEKEIAAIQPNEVLNPQDKVWEIIHKEG